MKTITDKFREWLNRPGRASFAAPSGSASDYNPAKCLRAEVERFKATNRFTPMDVTGFYIQAAVVLDEHRRMVEALKEIRDTNWCSARCGRIARNALPMSEERNAKDAERRGQRSGWPQNRKGTKCQAINSNPKR